jgi:hypothetical protein
MRHALGSLAAAALAVGILAWPAGPVHANGPWAHDPNVTVFTPTPRAPAAEEPLIAAPPVIVVNVVVGGRSIESGHFAGLLADVRKHRRHVKHGRHHSRRSIGHSGGKWAFAFSRGFRANWSFGTSRGFHSKASFGHGGSFKKGKSLHSSRGFGTARSFSTGRGDFGGGHGLR